MYYMNPIKVRLIFKEIDGDKCRSISFAIDDLVQWTLNHDVNYKDMLKSEGYEFVCMCREMREGIFEGDIVKGIGKEEGQSPIFFDAGHWQPFSYLNMSYSEEEFEVIGNIYEHPDILA